MRSSIGRKLLALVFIPFFAILLSLTGYIAYTLTEYVNNWTELEIKGISEINAADLEGRMDSVKISVLSASELIEQLNPYSDNCREQASDILKSLFNNRHIYNSWLAFEPNAFDYRDSEHVYDYPGSPSGRFIRSYIMEDNKIIEAPDMDEATLDDLQLSPWYVVPRDDNRLYIDVDNSTPNLYDYGLGAAPVYTLSIVSPIHRDGKVIGCVGADLLFDDMTFGIGGNKRASVAIFYPNGRIFYSQDLYYAEENIRSLNFNNTRAIEQAVSRGETLFLSDEYSVFLNTRAFTYFHPIGIAGVDDSSLSLYVATPRNDVYIALSPVFILIALIFATIVAVACIMFRYISHRVTTPLKNLTLAAENISRGYLEADIPAYYSSSDEIGLLSRSLHVMVEQFRVNISRLAQTREELTIHTQIEALFKTSPSINDALHALSALFCKHFQIYKTTVVISTNAKATAIGCLSEPTNARNFFEKDFPDFAQLEAAAVGKQILFLNSFAMTKYDMSYLDTRTCAVCIVPLPPSESFSAFIILENRDTHKSLAVIAEPVLLYAANILAEWLYRHFDSQSSSASRTDSDSLLPPHNSEFSSSYPLTYAAREIDGMDVNAAITAMGGIHEIYESSLALIVRLIPESIRKLEAALASDLHAFAIEIHGMKGALNNIGAVTLGNMSAKMEAAAKLSDSRLCNDLFTPFKELLSALFVALSSETGASHSHYLKPQGDIKALRSALPAIKEAIEAYDSLQAAEYLSTLVSFSYNEHTDRILAQLLLALEEYDCDKALHEINRLL